VCIKILTSMLAFIFILTFHIDEVLATDKCNSFEDRSSLTDIDFESDQLIFKYTQVEYFKISDRDIAQKNIQKAIINAKAELVKWMKNKTVVTETLEKSYAEIDTMTEDYQDYLVENVEILSENVSSQGEAYLTGVKVLEKCIDIEEKVVGVTIYWTPELSKLASKVNIEMTSQAKKQNREHKNTSELDITSNKSETNKVEANPAKKKIKISSKVVDLIIKVEGNGPSLTYAINEAIKSAIGQTYGQAFFAESEYSSVYVELDEYNSEGSNSAAASLEVQVDNIKTITRGLVKTYKIIERSENENYHKVILEVTIPKLESSISKDESTIIILPVKISNSNVDKGVNNFARSMRDTIIEFINKTKNITVLDRDHIKDQENEFNLMVQKSNITELAKLGNMAGADLIFVSEVLNYKTNIETRVVGEKTFKKMLIDSDLVFKIIDVATTNIIFSKRIPYTKQKIKLSGSNDKFGIKVGKRISVIIAKDIGGGFSSNIDIEADQKSNLDISKDKKNAEDMLEDIKDEVKDDW
jgi:hypothetical protein